MYPSNPFSTPAQLLRRSSRNKIVAPTFNLVALGKRDRPLPRPPKKPVAPVADESHQVQKKQRSISPKRFTGMGSPQDAECPAWSVLDKISDDQSSDDHNSGDSDEVLGEANKSRSDTESGYDEDEGGVDELADTDKEMVDVTRQERPVPPSPHLRRRSWSPLPINPSALLFFTGQGFLPSNNSSAGGTSSDDGSSINSTSDNESSSVSDKDGLYGSPDEASNKYSRGGSAFAGIRDGIRSPSFKGTDGEGRDGYMGEGEESDDGMDDADCGGFPTFSMKGLDHVFRRLSKAPPDAPATKQDVQTLVLCIQDMVVPPNPTSSDQPTPPCPGASQIKPDVASFRKKHRPAEKLDLQADVRALTIAVMGRKNGEPIDISHTAAPEDTIRFAETQRSEHGPMLTNLKVDIRTSTIASAWNKRAAILFSDHFREQPGCSEIDEENIRAAFMVHLQYLRKQFKSRSVHLNGTPGEKQRQVDRNKMDSRTARLRGLCERRQEACSTHGKDESISRLSTLMNRLPIDVMSGDETDHHNGNLCYVVKTLEWRNPKVEPFFLTLDFLHLSTRFKPDGRATRGKFPLPRVRNSGRPPVKGNPVAGLPSNFYNEDWLRKLDKFEIRALDIQPSVDLTLSPFLMRRAKRFSHVIDAQSVPLAHDDPSLPPV